MKTLMTLPDRVDHIVLGSDIGGLYTAALLSRVGHSVLVLESGDSVGNCTSECKGVEFDVGTTYKYSCHHMHRFCVKALHHL